ncbi:LysR family transcriptional regulator [Actinoallomurus soli]|uniref:LysR family transcriptional regulator n=1 Tax=Actinoallomurus soli TaxID=2952535 RepID=UPI0020930524|nr:LysR family transcriptional regulator [Actinoallomurus soli]MCO5967612.1 LysR family transcriptional regulator [Actinoallomurus soli]
MPKWHYGGDVDVSLQALRCFLAVAEDLHFTQAAERLGMTQPAVSKTIRRLEGVLGAPLFIRSRQYVELTDTGLSLLPVATRMLADFDDWARDLRAVRAEATRVLSVGYHSSVEPALTNAIEAGFRRLRPGWSVRMRIVDWADPARGVLEGTLRTALLRLPVPGQERLDLEVLRRDARYVALPDGHRLLDRDGVRLADLKDEEFVALPTASGPLRAFWLAADRFGRPPRIAAEVDNSEDFFQNIQSGRGVGMLTESSTRVYRRPGVHYRLVEDAEPSELAVVWERDGTDPIVRDFVRACLEAADPR